MQMARPGPSEPHLLHHLQGPSRAVACFRNWEIPKVCVCNRSQLWGTLLQGHPKSAEAWPAPSAPRRSCQPGRKLEGTNPANPSSPCLESLCPPWWQHPEPVSLSTLPLAGLGAVTEHPTLLYKVAFRFASRPPSPEAEQTRDGETEQHSAQAQTVSELWAIVGLVEQRHGPADCLLTGR